MAEKKRGAQDEVYFGPGHVAYVKPARGIDRGLGARPARLPEESFKVLAPHQPSKAEQKLIDWAKEHFDQMVVAEVQSVVHRSVKNFHTTPPNILDSIYEKARELSAGLPPRNL